MALLAGGAQVMREGRMTTPFTSEPQAGMVTKPPWFMLVLAAIGFAVNFKAWALLRPLGPVFGFSGIVGSQRPRRGRDRVGRHV